MSRHLPQETSIFRCLCTEEHYFPSPQGSCGRLIPDVFFPALTGALSLSLHLSLSVSVSSSLSLSYTYAHPTKTNIKQRQTLTDGTTLNISDLHSACDGHVPLILFLVRQLLPGTVPCSDALCQLLAVNKHNFCQFFAPLVVVQTTLCTGVSVSCAHVPGSASATSKGSCIQQTPNGHVLCTVCCSCCCRDVRTNRDKCLCPRGLHIAVGDVSGFYLMDSLYPN